MDAKSPNLPKFDKQRRKPPPDRPVQEKNSQKQAQKAGEPQFSTADPEGQYQYPIVEGQQKAKIGKEGVLWPQGTEKTV